MESCISRGNEGEGGKEGGLGVLRRVGRSGQAVVTVSTGHARIVRFNYVRNESCHGLRFR